MLFFFVIFVCFTFFEPHPFPPSDFLVNFGADWPGGLAKKGERMPSEWELLIV